MSNYHPTVEKILKLLSENEIWHETFEHEAVRTCEQSALTRPGYTQKNGAKAIIVRIKRSKNDKFLMMFVFPADQKFNTKKAKTILGAKDIRFATAEELESTTNGILPGAVPPFGQLFGLKILADPSLFNNEKIVFNAGDRCFSVAIKSEDYRLLAKPQVASIC